MNEKEKLQQFNNELKSHERNIVSFDKNNDFVLKDPTVDGFYSTIRVGFGGIYIIVNYWENGHWVGRVLDGSHTVARSSKPIIVESYKEFNK